MRQGIALISPGGGQLLFPAGRRFLSPGLFLRHLEKELDAAGARPVEFTQVDALPGRVSHSAYLPDRQQYRDWDRVNQSLDDEIEDGHQAMLKAVTRSWEILTPKQRQIMELSQAGATQEQIAIRLGVNKSTVSRTLGRAKRSMREEAERSLQEQKLDARHLDMADPATAKVILSAMTPKQAVYLYH